MKKQQSAGKIVIGWAEGVDFVDWGISDVQAKIDTGARTSVLHVEDFDRLPDGSVVFRVVVDRRDHGEGVWVRAKVLKWARVRSSTGIYRKRCFVRTRIRIGPIEKEIELSLASRERMVFRMLLGRKAIEKDFLVDVSRRRVLGRRARRNREPRTS